MGGTQSLHTNGFDEALGLPTERAAKIALRTQQIIGYESGVVDTPDPLGRLVLSSSRSPTRSRREAWEYIDRIDEMGGAVAAIEAGFQMDEIEQAAYEYTKSIDDGERVIVGVNRFVEDEPEPEVFPIDPALQREQVERVKAVRGEPRSTGGRAGAGRRSCRGSGYPEPASADAGSVVRAGDARRGQRRTTRGVRRLPPHALTSRAAQMRRRVREEPIVERSERRLPKRSGGGRRDVRGCSR